MPLSRVPKIGLGTWENNDPKQTPSSIAKAIELGYRHIDTAQVYFNEELVGQGVKQSGVSRDEIFLATKVSPSFLQPEDFMKSTSESISKLGVEYVDLLYIHWPAETYEPESTLGAFDNILEEGLTKHIAVSNFTPTLLDEALSISRNTFIANQVEMHPLLQQREMVEYTKQKKMHLVAYSPLAKGMIHDIPEIIEIAERHDITKAQVSLAWLLSKEHVIPIPKATSEEHQRENFEALDIQLSSNDLHLIESIQTEERIIDPYFAPDW